MTINMIDVVVMRWRCIDRQRISSSEISPEEALSGREKQRFFDMHKLQNFLVRASSLNSSSQSCSSWRIVTASVLSVMLNSSDCTRTSEQVGHGWWSARMQAKGPSAIAVVKWFLLCRFKLYCEFIHMRANDRSHLFQCHIWLQLINNHLTLTAGETHLAIKASDLCRLIFIGRQKRR